MLIMFLKLIVKTFFREITVKGLENLPNSGPAIFTPNHPNALIDPLLFYFLPSHYKICFVAKAPLFKISLLGWMMRKIGVIPVVRRFEAEGDVDYKAFFSACIDSLAAGESIVIFPEGVSLPQPHMANLKTGAARLYFLSLANDLNVHIIPIGLNYEFGSIFRTSVVMWIAPPLDTRDLIKTHEKLPQLAVIELTDRIGRTLDSHVFQSENFSDRELMLLLERIYNDGTKGDTWMERLERLKQFEAGLNALSNSHFLEIHHLRQMLYRYRNLYKILEARQSILTVNPPYRPKRFIMAISGFPVACLGWLLTLMPYQLCDLIVKRIKKYNESAAATYKVVYALFLFPLAFLLEILLIYLWLGWVVSITFALGVIPVSYFTLYFFEWLYDGGWGIPIPSVKLRQTSLHQISKQLEEERSRIIALVEELAAQVEQYPNGPEQANKKTYV